MESGTQFNLSDRPLYLTILNSSAEREADPELVAAEAIKLPTEKVSVHIVSQIRLLPNF